MSQPLYAPRGPWIYRSGAGQDTAKPLTVVGGFPTDTQDALIDGVIQVRDADIVLGDNIAQGYIIQAGQNLPFDYLPIGEVFVKNRTSGETATLHFLGFVLPGGAARGGA